MQGTIMQGTIMQGTIMQGTIMQGTIMQGTIMQGTIMQGFFTRQVKPFVFQQSVFDFFHGAAHGRFAHAKTAGQNCWPKLLAT